MPDDPLVRETMAALGPGAKNATLDDLTAWIRQLEELCDSKDAALAPTSFRTDIRGSCLSTFPASGRKPSTAAQTIKLQTKAVKGYPPLPELYMEKVSSKKKNARGEAKLRLSVERGPVLVLLTITDLHDATHTLRVVMEDDNDLIPIKHPATTIEATAVPFAPDQLLERLRHAEAKIKPQRKEQVQPSASPPQYEEDSAAQGQADGVTNTEKRIIEHCFDREKGTLAMRTSGCSNPLCDEVNCSAASTTLIVNAKTGEAAYTTEGPAEQGGTVELANRKSEFANLKDLARRNAGIGGWVAIRKEEMVALFEKARPKDPIRYEAFRCRALAALNEYAAIEVELKLTLDRSKKNRLAMLLGRKKTEYNEAMSAIAVIAGGSKQKDSKQLYAAFVREDKASVPGPSP